MNNIFALYKQAKGSSYLRQSIRNRLFVLILFELLVLGITKKSLEIIRIISDYILYKREKRKSCKLIRNYLENNTPYYVSNELEGIIWVCWLQGIDNAPFIVRKCIDSIKKSIPDRKMILITHNNYSSFVEFPQYILNKYEKGYISNAHFSDLLRIELLSKYGGTWIDSTVFCSGNPSNLKQNYMLNDELFFFQDLKPGLDGHAYCVSNWFITAKPNNKIILLTRFLLYNYWKKHKYVKDYYIFHIFFQIALETYPEEWSKVIPFSNSIPHITLLRLFETYDEKKWNAIKNLCCFHKLSYKFSEEEWEKQGTYYKVIIENIESFTGVKNV